MKKNRKVIILIILFTISITSIFQSCSSVFSATISGIVKAELRDNSTSDELINVEDAKVYVFFNENEFNNYKSKWESISKNNTKSLEDIIELPSLSKTIRVTSTNVNGNFSLKTMWKTPSPLFGKDGDEETFNLAIYHKDFGMFFDDTKYSVFSDSSQNINFVCKYNDKLMSEYTISINTIDYSANNTTIDINTVNPKVIIKYKLVSENNIESDVGEITQIYEEVPNNSNSYTFLADKYLYNEDSDAYTSEKVYPKGEIYFYDKGATGEKNYRMCNEEGEDLSTLGTSFSITSNSNILEKDIYVDRLKRDYRINFDLQYPDDNDNNDYSGEAPTLAEFSPITTIKVYFDGYDATTNTITTTNNTIDESELYKTITYTADNIPVDEYYSFNLNRLFKEGSEIYPSISFLLEDDENDIEYIQTTNNGLIIDETNTLDYTQVDYSKDNYSTSVDTYLDRVKLEYTIQFNLENYEDGTPIAINTDDDATEDTYNPNIKLYILPYDGESASIASLDFSTATAQSPDSQINNNTYTFEWQKYDETNTIQYPILKYFIFDNSTTLYTQVATEDNITFKHIKDKTTALQYVEEVPFKKGVLNKNIEVEMEELNEEYTINFTLKDIEDNNNEVALTTFNPKVKLNIYKTSTLVANLVDTILYKEINANGDYSFSWSKYGEDLDLEDLPNDVNENRLYPIVKYYLFNNDEDSYQMLLDNSTNTPTVVTTIDNAPSTELYSENETTKNETVYIRNKKVIFNITFKLVNIATNEEILIRTINPIIRLTYNNGSENITDTYNEPPTNDTYIIKVERDNNPISVDIAIDLEDKRDDIRYRMSSNDPSNADPILRYTVGDSDTDRYEKTVTLNKALDNEITLDIKDYQYLNTLELEGRYINTNDSGDNYHEVWLIVEDNNTFDEEDAIKLPSPTRANYINATTTYDPQNIENGYFSYTYNQNKIAPFSEYSPSSKYLYQEVKVIVNSIAQEASPTIDALDYMSIEAIKNSATTSTYIYVDTATTYTP